MSNDFQSREIDASRPSAARMYHYYLSGEAVFDVDRMFGEKIFQIFPYADVWAHHNRGFLQRATTFMVSQGIRQFLDIGSGLPTVGNTHEVAREIAPEARVVYVDNDLEAVARSHELLEQQHALDTTAVIEADLRCPDLILGHPDTRRLIDFDRPLGLLIVSVWPFVPDSDRPYELMAQLRDRLPAGSYVAMSHGSIDDAAPEVKERIRALRELYKQTSDPGTYRTRDEFAAFFDGFELVEPGLVHAPDWRPTESVDSQDPARPCNFAAVGYKP
ncbi:SAM-dependent methyltransferase [Nocardia sp. CDC159]|uniref:SAM-dependent methyltransferase n=1 Tax=Nocardia pulmonis TaxID=2951408 RepID=A0A9X2E5V9_9NOCA|nr:MULTISPECIES: SAM-dependent methyltransferase [Nocardia]MCM6774231.1 SAM-dependent methyltransferase [Nocardia pulmonis]MCM6787118.1 SAM-dependent methyltransferase [Nocardia sp. CDC159]